jgi:hypothetical protein
MRLQILLLLKTRHTDGHIQSLNCSSPTLEPKELHRCRRYHLQATQSVASSAIRVITLYQLCMSNTGWNVAYCLQFIGWVGSEQDWPTVVRSELSLNAILHDRLKQTNTIASSSCSKPTAEILSRLPWSWLRSELSSGLYCRVKYCRPMFQRCVLGPWWWRQYATLKRRSTIILHGSTTQKTTLNIILAAVRTWNLTNWLRFWDGCLARCSIQWPGICQTARWSNIFGLFIRPRAPHNGGGWDLWWTERRHVTAAPCSCVIWGMDKGSVPQRQTTACVLSRLFIQLLAVRQ